MPGVGFGTGVERILLALGADECDVAAERRPVAYVVALSDEARTAGVRPRARAPRAGGRQPILTTPAGARKGQMTQAGRSRRAVRLHHRRAESWPSELVTVRDLSRGVERHCFRGPRQSRSCPTRRN